MASYNRIVLVGNLTRDPQLSFRPSNTAICKFGLAMNHKWRDREGNTREEVCFVDCTVFAKSAEVFNQYMSKGRSVLVEGRLSLNQWTTPEGDKRSKHEVVVDNFTFLGGGRGDSEVSSPERSASAATSGAAGAEPPQGRPPTPTDDDIPF